MRNIFKGDWAAITKDVGRELVVATLFCAVAAILVLACVGFGRP